MNGDTETRLALAKACAASDSDESCNILITLLRDREDSVKLEAVKSLGKIGNDHATAQLQWLLNQLPAEKTELIGAIHEAIKNVRHKQ